MSFFKKLFGVGQSRQTAKERLQLVLIHDRADISPEVMENLRRDLIAVISTYMEIDDSNIELDLEREDRSVALVASIPIRNVRRNAKVADKGQ
ncbi:MAG: cell division topological specificity factor MinE [Synergistaceae bacterium]|nr:cell division topological specificity factor MinE [Synergistaceae bacterium]